MHNLRRLTPEALVIQLRRCLRHGARTSRLLKFTPELVELIYPAEDYPDVPIYDRAIQVEQLLRQATEAVGGTRGQAAAILLALAPGTLGTKLEERRRQAAELLGILPDTLRRRRHEGLLLWDVAVEVYGLSKREQ